MSIYPRILCAVRDTDPRRASALAKVFAFAQACEARLELFHSISAPLYLPERAHEITIADLKRDTAELHRSRLERLADGARRKGIDVTCTAIWDHPPHEAIIRRAAETRADLIVAQGHEGGGRRWYLRFTDWELVRTSPVPVLLMRDPAPYRRPAILAAVDPLHAHDKSAALDENILAAGRGLAAILRGQLHVVHANHPPLLGIAAETPFVAEDLLSQDRREFERFMGRSDVAARRRHLVEGHPDKVIARVADDIGARIVVMGAVSRSGFKRLLIGNTAERILDRIDCDVLVVKPDEFRDHVPHARRDSLVLAPAPSNVLPA